MTQEQAATTGPGTASPAPSVRQPTFQWAAGPAIPVLSVVIALIFGAVFVRLSGNDPVAAYSALVQGAFGTPYDITETLVSAIPLVLTCLAVSLASLGYGFWRALPAFLGIGLSGGLIAALMPLAAIAQCACGTWTATKREHL